MTALANFEELDFIAADERERASDGAGIDGLLKAALVTHMSALKARALFLTRDPAAASDLFQDTVERALAKQHRRRDSIRLGSWLMTIMQNLFIDHYRAARTWRFVPNADAILSRLPESAAEPENLWRKVDDDLLETVIAGLPPAFRHLYLMHAGGASYLEIAKSLGIPPNTVATRLFRVRRRLRQQLTAALHEGTSSVADVVAFPRPSTGSRRTRRAKPRGKGPTVSRLDRVVSV